MAAWLVLALFGFELGEALMQATFPLAGPSSRGTAFLVSYLVRDDPGATQFVLVTAAHVLDSMPDANARLLLHAASPDTAHPGTWLAVPIRRDSRPLWTRHPDISVDVAVLPLTVPAGVQVFGVPEYALGGDVALESAGLHPGDELCAVGYPPGADPGGFPLALAGRIASFPLYPARTVRVVLGNFRSPRGTSGAPVFFSEHVMEQDSTVRHVEFIAGMVSRERFIASGETGRDQAVALTVIVPAQFIRETLARLRAGSP